MKIAVVGTGYVGLVAGTCFAEYGNRVACVDIDARKIERLQKGILPIYEPGLSEMVLANHKRKRLEFTTDLGGAVKQSDIIFIAVGTPDAGDGRPDMRGVLTVAREIGRHMNGYKIIVDKSTVPVGTADQVRAAVAENATQAFDVVSNPEFLREGRAIDDFMKPERVVIGADSEKAGRMMQELYAPFVKETDHPVFIMNVRSAELAKYACNAFLAMKVSFANEVANLCDALGADYTDVRLALGTDSRIGRKFLNAGIGYGGSCFPKDVRAIVQIAEDAGIQTPLIREVENTNESQKLRLVRKMLDHYQIPNPGPDTFKGRRFAVWGLAFKPGTDDMRDAPSIDIIRALTAYGAVVVANDPAAHETAYAVLKDTISYVDMYDAADGADALLLLTEWPEYQEPDLERLRSGLKHPVVFDGRNIYNPEVLRSFGFTHIGMGTRSVGT